MPFRLRQLIVILCLVALGSCSSPTAPPPPPPDAPTLTCPASVSLVSPDGARVPFPFPLPTPVNGKAPVTVSCTGPSGAGFPAGPTVVTCTATDALSRQASCNFTVTVTVTPKIALTKFLAFGDSITYGRCGPAPNECPQYTVRLEQLLRERYTSQNFLMVTRGVPGERTSGGGSRLPDEVSAYNPEVVLLMEGTNDVTNDVKLNESEDALEYMINAARSRGAKAVFIATIPPIAPGGPNSSAIPKVLLLNAEIRDLAARTGAHLVDVYAALNADVNRYYVGNDLHPTGEGLRVIGETFYAKIREKLDITPIGNLQSGIFNLKSPVGRR
ncbi:MAG TPA: GDSL-type esterase/lipase family protein [Vicinamibacterales bacterium]|nr:GDSL-type esterase/lipase family protein [Vicinamibacterales bacterium]